jgi:3-hydroxybutyryl-CoA dehydrogenase
MMISKIAIVGSGTMGTGVHKLLEKYNFDVHLLSARKLMSVKLTEIDIVKSADLIIEASSENLESKLEILKMISDTNLVGTIASTTSSLSIADLSQAIISADRFCGIHFMNPATVIPVVEFTPSSEFSLFRKEQVTELLKSIDRIVFETLDQPGFVLNALLFPFLNRAIYMVEGSKMSPQDVDQIMMKVCGHKLGPLATLDLIGLDVSLEIMTILRERDPKFDLPPANLLLTLVSEKRLGKKTGNGFYDY